MTVNDLIRRLLGRAPTSAENSERKAFAQPNDEEERSRRLGTERDMTWSDNATKRAP
jgi:hypothetical protein